METPPDVGDALSNPKRLAKCSLARADSAQRLRVVFQSFLERRPGKGREMFPFY